MNTRLQSQTSKEYFNSLSIIHLGLTSGQILFALVLYFLHESDRWSSQNSDWSSSLNIIVPILIISGVAGGIFLNRKNVEEIKEQKELKDKMVKYRTALLLKFALWEGPSLVSLVGFLLTGNYLFLGLSAVVIGLFLLNRPSKDSVINELELSQSHKAILDNPDSIIIP